MAGPNGPPAKRPGASRPGGESLDTANTVGWRAALEKVRNRLETSRRLGYKTAGVVVQVDPRNALFRVGDCVACGGNESALNAEYIAVPDLLVGRVPDGVENRQAAYATIVSIALRAVRQLELSLADERRALRLRYVSPLSLTLGTWVSCAAHKVFKLLRSGGRVGESLDT